MFLDSNLSIASIFLIVAIALSAITVIIVLALKWSGKGSHGFWTCTFTAFISVAAAIFQEMAFVGIFTKSGDDICSVDRYGPDGNGIEAWLVEYPAESYPEVAYMRFFQNCELGTEGKFALAGFSAQLATAILISTNYLFASSAIEESKETDIPDIDVSPVSSKSPDEEDDYENNSGTVARAAPLPDYETNTLGPVAINTLGPVARAASTPEEEMAGFNAQLATAIRTSTNYLFSFDDAAHVSTKSPDEEADCEKNLVGTVARAAPVPDYEINTLGPVAHAALAPEEEMSVFSAQLENAIRISTNSCVASTADIEESKETDIPEIDAAPVSSKSPDEEADYENNPLGTVARAAPAPDYEINTLSPVAHAAPAPGLEEKMSGFSAQLANAIRISTNSLFVSPMSKKTDIPEIDAAPVSSKSPDEEADYENNPLGTVARAAPLPDYAINILGPTRAAPAPEVEMFVDDISYDQPNEKSFEDEIKAEDDLSMAVDEELDVLSPLVSPANTQSSLISSRSLQSGRFKLP
jgi:hypothetical protein